MRSARISYMYSSARRCLSSSPKSPTGIVMLNMGGPSTSPEVEPFLTRLFTDPEIIGLGRFQKYIGPFIASRRTPKVKAQYELINGSPIRKWTRIQGEGMVERLNTDPNVSYKAYTAFRYADPLTEETLLKMKADGIKRAIAFSQYPQYSCTTAGSSFNHLWRELARLGMKDTFSWSIIDRWPLHEGYIRSVAKHVQEALEQVREGYREDAVIVFSSHSLPLKVVERGDQYMQEMCASVQAVMDQIGYRNSYIHAWQSKVGYLPWIAPQTSTVLAGLGKQGHKAVVVVPLGFTSDHVETLFELDIENKEIAEKAGISEYIRARALNDEPMFLDCLADIVREHVKSGKVSSQQYRINCHGCVNPSCRSVVNPISNYSKLRLETPSAEV